MFCEHNYITKHSIYSTYNHQMWIMMFWFPHQSNFLVHVCLRGLRRLSGMVIPSIFFQVWLLPLFQPTVSQVCFAFVSCDDSAYSQFMLLVLLRCNLLQILSDKCFWILYSFLWNVCTQILIIYFLCFYLQSVHF